MSASAENETSTNQERICVKNVIWLDTIFWSFKCDFDKLNLNEFFRSNLMKIPNLEEVFYFQAGKTSPSVFSIQLHRVLIDPDERPDDGFLLNMHFMLIGSRIEPESILMDHSTDEVTVSYELDVMKTRADGFWTIKCVIKLLEKNCLCNEAYEQQTEMLKNLAKRHDSVGRKTLEMAFLLKRKSLDDILSGRQGMEFALQKLSIIDRTFTFVSEIAMKFARRLKKIDYHTATDLGVYLGYIHNGHLNGISKKECASLYITAHLYGLDFLKVECSEFMMKNINSEFVIDLLIVTDLVNDFLFMRRGLDVFLCNRHAIMNSERWKNLTDRSLPVAQSIVDASIRRAMSDDCEVLE